jgi:hypothetical protein
VDPDGYVCGTKGMYGLYNKAAQLAFDNLVKKLAPHGLLSHPFFPWTGDTKPDLPLYTLQVDDFGIK